MPTIDAINVGGTDYTIQQNTAALTPGANIDGVAFDGSVDITHYGVCNTAAATAAKTVTVTDFVLVPGASVTVKFTNANTAVAPTLNVTSTGAKSIAVYGSTLATSGQWNAGSAVDFIYDGTRWLIVGVAGTDVNLSVPHAAADSAAVGEAIGGVEDIIASEYDAAATYAIGDYCIYNGKLYKCATAIATGETWTPSHWVQIVVGDKFIAVDGVADYEASLVNNGVFQITANTLESGVWNYSRKSDSTSRARIKFLLPVRAGMQIYYENTTFDSYFGILETPTSYGSYLQFGAWYTGSSGTLNVTHDGYLVFNIRNHADTTATVDPADFDGVVMIMSTIHQNVLLKYTGAAPTSIADLPGNSWWVASGSVLAPIMGETFTWTLDTTKIYYVRVYQLSDSLRRFEVGATGGITYWAGWKTTSTPNIGWATILPDSTLSVSGVPADSKAVGDVINENVLVKYTGSAPETSITELPNNSWWFVLGSVLQPLLGPGFVWELSASSNYVVRKYFLQGTIKRYEVFTAGGTMLWSGYATTGNVVWSKENIPNLINTSESIILTKSGATSNGITWEWQSDGSCKAWGTATGVSVNNIIPGADLPDFLNPSLREISGNLNKLIAGDNVEFSYKSTSNKVWINVWWYNGTTKYEEVKNGHGILTIPQDTTRWGVRLYVASGTTISEDEPVIVSHIHIKKFCEDVPTGGGVTTAKFLGFGHSVTTGSVWTEKPITETTPHGVGYDHLCPYDDSPYGGLASGLGIRKENVDYTLISSTTFMTDEYSEVGGANCYLNRIKNTNLTPYDYVLAQLASRDLRLCPLGSLSSTAGDGSIVGGILDMLEYIQTSNPLCQPIVLSTLPYNKPGTGVDVFHTQITLEDSDPPVTTTIAQMDELMHQLAEREHFIYVDFQEMWLSYHWHDFTADPVDSFLNVHLNSDRAYRIVGEYLRRKVAGA